MRNAPLLIFCLLLSACSAAPNQTLVTKTQAAYSLADRRELPKALRVPLTFEHGYLFVYTTVNGEDAGKMLLDTGSTLNIIDKGVVGRLGLKEVGRGKTRGIAGTSAFTVHQFDSLAIAGLDLGVKQAGSLSMNKLLTGRLGGVGGLIGSVSLLPHPFTIDYARQELVVYNASTFVQPKGAQHVRLTFYNRLPAVRAKLANGREVVLIIDTGADNAISLPMEVSNWPGILAVGASGGGAARGVGGQIQTLRSWLNQVDVFGYKLKNVPVTFEPLVHKPTRDGVPVGRIGSQALKGFRLTFEAIHRDLWVSFARPAQP